ncbi:MAG: PASTA domain-containing protein, partial [Cyclobacteriaceae bacterium]
IGIAVIIVLVFFYIFLPLTTNHGETITVPSVVNQHVDDLDNILNTRSLRYEVNVDSGYSDTQEPFTVLDQFPKANSKVKENRKIYVTLNSSKPPLVKMPDLIDKSLKIAEITLQSFGLKSGKKEYKPDLALNVILEQRLNGREVLAGEMIPKGSKIDLTIGDGYGNRTWEMYSYINQSLSDTRVTIAGSGLELGNVNYVDDPISYIISKDQSGNTKIDTVTVSLGYVVRQLPRAGRTVRIGDAVDLWIYHPDSLAQENAQMMGQ